MDASEPTRVPRISVLVAVREAGDLLAGCLECLLDQTALDELEILVLDGGDTRVDRRTVERFTGRHQTLRYLGAGTGLYAAWNLGIRAARGTYLANLNADDRLRNDALKLLADALDREPEVALVYGDSLVTDRPDETYASNSSGGRRLELPCFSSLELLKRDICGPHPMWRRSVHDTVGFFDESFRTSGDWDMWLRIARRYRIRRFDDTLGLFYRNTNGLSASDPLRRQEEDRLVKRRHIGIAPP